MPGIFPDLNPMFAFNMTRFHKIMGQQMTRWRSGNRQNVIILHRRGKLLCLADKSGIDAVRAIQRTYHFLNLPTDSGRAGSTIHTNGSRIQYCSISFFQGQLFIQGYTIICILDDSSGNLNGGIQLIIPSVRAEQCYIVSCLHKASDVGNMAKICRGVCLDTIAVNNQYFHLFHLINRIIGQAAYFPRPGRFPS